MSRLAEQVITAFGYPGLLALMLAENLFPPIPSERPSEKPHFRANRLTIKRLIATYMNASPLSGTLS